MHFMVEQSQAFNHFKVQITLSNVGQSQTMGFLSTTQNMSQQH